MERKLATVEKILKIEPIENADNIEKATVKGWQCVVKKGDFKVNENIVFFEVDSILPEKPEFEFLRKGCWNERYKGFRLRTIKLRKQISQGLVMPISIIDKEIFVVNNGQMVFDVGTDVTSLLDIQKYVPEIPSCLSGKAKGVFPDFIPKTDEERIQNIPELLIRQKGTECYITEKLDGTSATFFVKDGVFGVCGRNWEWLEDDKNSYWKIARKYNLEEKLKKLIRNTAIQGEIIGPGIQKNKYNLDEIELYVFNVFDIKWREYNTIFEVERFCRIHDLKVVPIQTKKPVINGDVNYWIELSEGNSILNDKIKREGIVVRSIYDRSVSFKAINPDFLLKHKE